MKATKATASAWRWPTSLCLLLLMLLHLAVRSSADCCTDCKDYVSSGGRSPFATSGDCKTSEGVCGARDAATGTCNGMAPIDCCATTTAPAATTTAPATTAASANTTTATAPACGNDGEKAGAARCCAAGLVSTQEYPAGAPLWKDDGDGTDPRVEWCRSCTAEGGNTHSQSWNEAAKLDCCEGLEEVEENATATGPLVSSQRIGELYVSNGAVSSPDKVATCRVKVTTTSTTTTTRTVNASNSGLTTIDPCTPGQVQQPGTSCDYTEEVFGEHPWLWGVIFIACMFISYCCWICRKPTECMDNCCLNAFSVSQGGSGNHDGGFFHE